MTFHTQVVGANGQRQAMFIERVEGLAEAILANFRLAPPDVMIVFSAGGTTAVPIEMAIGARAARPPRDRGDRGRAVAGRAGARTPPAPGCSTTPTSSSTCGTPPGDALVALDGVDTPVGPGSTITASRSSTRSRSRTAELLDARGALPPVITSAPGVGAERSRALFDAAYAEHARRLARVLRTTEE